MVLRITVRGHFTMYQTTLDILCVRVPVTECNATVYSLYTELDLENSIALLLLITTTFDIAQSE